MADVIANAIAALRDGRPIVLPTDTVYGLFANAYRDGPVRRTYAIKHRPESIPSALMFTDLEMMLECLPELRGRSARIARALLPGPYTLVFPNPARRFRWVTGTVPETIAVRVPVLPAVSRAVLESVGAVMATSANLHGGPDPRRVEDIPAEIRAACGAVVDGGELPGIASTVVDFTAPEPRVIREGAVPSAEILDRAGLGA